MFTVATSFNHGQARVPTDRLRFHTLAEARAFILGSVIGRRMRHEVIEDTPETFIINAGDEGSLFTLTVVTDSIIDANGNVG